MQFMGGLIQGASNQFAKGGEVKSELVEQGDLLETHK
jgi:hypothetical protein